MADPMRTIRVELVLWLLAEGVNRAVLVRYSGHKDATLARWLERMGEHHVLIVRDTLRMPLIPAA